MSIVTDTIKSSYYTQLETMKQIAAEKAGTKKRFFILHFDKKIGPCLAASDDDQHIKDSIRGVSIRITDPQRLFHTIDEEIREKITNIMDIMSADETVRTWLNKGKIWVPLFYFQVENRMARGEQEMFQLAFLDTKPRLDKRFIEIEKNMKKLLKKFFDVINGKDISAFETEINMKNQNPTPEFIVKEFYKL